MTGVDPRVGADGRAAAGPAAAGGAAGRAEGAAAPGGPRRAEEFRGSPNPIAHHYRRFEVGRRLLLTGHSHQAWPDVSLEGHHEAWLDAARHVDRKWGPVAERSAEVVAAYRRLMGGLAGDYALDTNTHALVTRFVSALPLRTRPRIVSTAGEFHTIRRQLDRLSEEGVEVVRVPPMPTDDLPERLQAALDDRTACVMVSSVLFESGLRVPGLAEVAAACARHGVELLVDAYHHLNVVPFDPEGLDEAYVVAGGYKYCQFGEGVCVLRLPPDCALRPVLTGWFSEFGELAEEKRPGAVRYGAGAARFAGSTFEPTAHYRAARVARFFRDEGLGVALLREVSQRQVAVLAASFLAHDLDPGVVRLDPATPLEARAGFLAFEAPEATRLSEALRERGVWTDARGRWLRFGPAPYLEERQLRSAVDALAEVVRR